MAHDRVTTAGAYATDVDAPAPVKRTSWGAILAGVIIVLIVQVLLSMLGVGIGASTVDVVEGQSPQASTIGIGAGIWWVVASLISVAVGAWVAGRLAGMPKRIDGALHGLVTWGLSALVVFYLATSAMSSLVGGAFSVVGSAVQTAGQAVYQGGQAASNAANQNMQLPGALGQFQEQVEQRLDQIMSQANQQLQQAADNPDVRDALRRIVTGGDGLNQADKDRAINVIVENTDMSRQDVEQQIQKLQQAYQELVQQAKEAAEVAANTVAQAAIWAFIALVVGAVVGAAAGAVGSPRDIRSRAYR
ncbi:MAG: hypothetical protein JNM75_01815 [Rhodospirillales bacterium]|nr:hypothetical protein [Rhodospirillales bacterium]